MTRDKVNVLGEGSVFANLDEVHRAFYARQVNFHAIAKVRIEEHVANEAVELVAHNTIYDTTVGRTMLYCIVPKVIPFAIATRAIDMKALSPLINDFY